MNIRKTDVAWDPNLLRIEHRDDERNPCYNIRESDVAWDPNLVRIEYLDDEGNPFYCSFETRVDDECQGELQLSAEINGDGSRELEDIATAADWFGARSRRPHYSLFMLSALLIVLLGAVVLAAR
jgi:hypothetical protein